MFDDRILELADRDPLARQAWIDAAISRKVKVAKLNQYQDVAGVGSFNPKQPKRPSEQRIGAGAFGERRYDLNDPADVLAAHEAGLLDLMQYRRALEAIAAKADDAEDSEDDDLEELDEEDELDEDDNDSRGTAPGPSIPARRQAARHFDRQVRLNMRSIGSSTNTRAARAARFNAMVSAGFSPSDAAHVLEVA